MLSPEEIFDRANHAPDSHNFGGTDLPQHRPPSFTAIVKDWDTPEEAITYAASAGLTREKLIDRNYMTNEAENHHEADTGRSLRPLFGAIRNRFRRFDKFKLWMGDHKGVSYQYVVESWETPADALRYADYLGITREQLLDPNFLRNQSRLPPEQGGIGRNLGVLARWISGRYNQFAGFKVWMGEEGDELLSTAVRSWDAAQFLSFAQKAGITRQQLTTRTYLEQRAKLPREEGGIGRNLRGVATGVSNRFGRFSKFRAWLDNAPTAAHAENLRKKLDTDEGRGLEALATELGDEALADYLSVKYQDRFQYSRESIENLRRYLGEIEVERFTGEETFPVDILTLPELGHLREILFSHYRDKFQLTYSRQGIPTLREELENKIETADSPHHAQFFRSLRDYFNRVDAISSPSRLKTRINSHGEFPAPHQLVAVEEILEKRAMLLADEMGGGKTGSSIAGFEVLREQGKASKALVVCPAQVMPVWKKALSDQEGGLFEDGSAPKVAFIESAEDWEKAKDADYVVISIERLGRESNGQSNEELLKELGADYLIVDECHNLKNPAGTNTDLVYRISQEESIVNGHIVLLSGTPATNTTGDIAAQIRLLYAGRKEFQDFDITDLRSLSRMIRSGDPRLVRNLLVPHMLRRRTEDCLPVGCEFHREVVRVTLNPYEQALYEAIVDDPFLTAKEKILLLKRQCLESETKYTSLRQAIDTALERPKYKESGTPPKIVIAESTFAKGITRDEHDARPDEDPGQETYFASRLINDLSESVEVFVLDSKNSHRREQILKEFKECDRPAALLTLVPVIGEGLDISCASDGILISPTYTVSAEEQLFRRMLRLGQTLSVDFQVLQIDETIEQGVMEYALRKERVVRKMLDGCPLTSEERDLLDSNPTEVRRGGHIAYAVLSPRQKALWILNRIYGKGKEEIHRFLTENDGKYAKDFAEGYPQDEATSYSGNTARVVSAIIDEVKPTGKFSVADIACGCRTLQRLFEGESKITVASTDINEAALKVGGELLAEPVDVQREEVSPMDQLPYDDESMDIAVISLALEFARHHLEGRSGEERMNSLAEFNRVVKPSGVGIVTFQESLFSDADAFRTFAETVASNFGFEIIEERTGFAQATDNTADDNFGVWALTLQKVSDPRLTMNIEDVWLNLRFPRKKDFSTKTAGSAGPRSEPQGTVGAYHEEFSIKNNSLRFRPSTSAQQSISNELTQAKNDYVRLEARIRELIQDHGTISDIPEHLLLSISLDDVGTASQHERDLYFKLLLEHYGGPTRVPVDLISKESSIVLIRVEPKKKGIGLCLARLDGSGKKGCGYGKRYFYE